jgi:hypothetical protein
MFCKTGRALTSTRTALKRSSYPIMYSRGLGSSSITSSSDYAYLDFCLFVEALRKDGDLAEINEEVDPHLEVAAITHRAYERRAKAPLFNNVKGAHDGLFRIMVAPEVSGRIQVQHMDV